MRVFCEDRVLDGPAFGEKGSKGSSDVSPSNCVWSAAYLSVGVERHESSDGGRGLCTYRGASPIRKRSPPSDLPRTLGIGLRQGARGVRFLVSEVPLYISAPRQRRRTLHIGYRGTSPPPLGPYRRPMPRVLGGSEGGGRFLMGEIPLYM